MNPRSLTVCRNDALASSRPERHQHAASIGKHSSKKPHIFCQLNDLMSNLSQCNNRKREQQALAGGVSIQCPNPSKAFKWGGMQPESGRSWACNENSNESSQPDRKTSWKKNGIWNKLNPVRRSTHHSWLIFLCFSSHSRERSFIWWHYVTLSAQLLV